MLHEPFKTFSPDSRWLIASSLDSIIRTYDVPTSRLIDAFRTPSVATSVSFSPTNDFLATSHVDSVGIYSGEPLQIIEQFQQSDRPLTGQTVHSMTLSPSRASATTIWPTRHFLQCKELRRTKVSQDNQYSDRFNAPSLSALDSLSPLSAQQEATDVFMTPPQLDGELITLTLLPRSRWQNAAHLEVIQVRLSRAGWNFLFDPLRSIVINQKSPQKPQKRRPFFLPTLPGVETRFAVETAEQETTSKKSTRRLENAAGHSQSQFHRQLNSESREGDCRSRHPLRNAV